MSTPTETAIAKQDRSPANLVPMYEGEFDLVLPSHVKAASFVQLAVAALRKNPQLMEAATADPGSLIFALRDAARLGLQPGTEQYWLTCRKVKGKWTVLGIPGYEGEIELIYRAGAVESVIVEAVYSGDTFRYVPGQMDKPVHEVDWFGDRGDVIGSYAYAIMRGGATSKVVVVGAERIARALKASPTSGSDYSPWKSDRTAMILKTAAHDLTKWVPTSAEYLREQLRAVADVKAEQESAPFTAPDLPATHDPATGQVFDQSEHVEHVEHVEVAEGVIVEDPPEDPWADVEVTQPPSGAT